jgi:hypothetical protein
MITEPLIVSHDSAFTMLYTLRRRNFEHCDIWERILCWRAYQYNKLNAAPFYINRLYSSVLLAGSTFGELKIKVFTPDNGLVL